MIALLGNGMLGSMVNKTLKLKHVRIDRRLLDAESPELDLRMGTCAGLIDYDWVINCIGIIRPLDVEQAIRVNALFPYFLPPQTIQIATDCVYSGIKGNYVESDPHNATDVYGKTKSLGEAPHIKNLRCSIIGPELKNHRSLLDWFLAQNKVQGYTNHLWNGITTYHFAKIVMGAIRERIELPRLQHIVPADTISKADLLKLFAKAFNHDIPIKDTFASESIDRTLSTNNPELNLKLWQAAGYKEPPTIAEMVEELSQL